LRSRQAAQAAAIVEIEPATAAPDLLQRIRDYFLADGGRE
jgi:hypothetical protein